MWFILWSTKATFGGDLMTGHIDTNPVDADHEVSNGVDDAKFAALLRRWNSHQELRRRGAPVPSLAASRLRLDSARDQLRRAAA